MRARVAVALACLLLTGCSTFDYLSQAASGHLGLLAQARAVEDLIADPEVSQRLKERLLLARDMRRFASTTLGLPENRSYMRYAGLGRPYAVWNVVATGEFSVHPVRSCFPFAGCTDYRGFFDAESAEHYAGLLRASGHDVLVYGVPAYSTLGYFDDPLLSSFIDYPEHELARLLFHELAHQQEYVKDDSSFNESFAIVVEREGVRRWFAEHGRPEMLAIAAASIDRTAAFNALLLGTRARAEALYRANRHPEETADIRQGKAQMMAELKSAYEALRREWGGSSGYDRLVGEQPNNALLAIAHTYARWVPAFERMLHESDGDLPRFYGRVKALAAQSAEARDSALARLLQ